MYWRTGSFSIPRVYSDITYRPGTTGCSSHSSIHASVSDRLSVTEQVAYSPKWYVCILWKRDCLDRRCRQGRGMCDRKGMMEHPNVVTGATGGIPVEYSIFLKNLRLPLNGNIHRKVFRCFGMVPFGT